VEEHSDDDVSPPGTAEKVDPEDDESEVIAPKNKHMKKKPGLKLSLGDDSSSEEEENPGTFGFDSETVHICGQKEKAVVHIIRTGGSSGTVKVSVDLEADTAEEFMHYVPLEEYQKGIYFGNSETVKDLEITLIPQTQELDTDKSFKVNIMDDDKVLKTCTVILQNADKEQQAKQQIIDVIEDITNDDDLSPETEKEVTDNKDVVIAPEKIEVISEAFLNLENKNPSYLKEEGGDKPAKEDTTGDDDFDRDDDSDEDDEATNVDEETDKEQSKKVIKVNINVTNINASKGKKAAEEDEQP